MPWEIKPEGGQYCVYRVGDAKPLKCHSTHEKAVAHLRALYANEERMDEGFYIDSGFQVDLFGDGGAVAQRVLQGEPVLILPKGTYWRYG